MKKTQRCAIASLGAPLDRVEALRHE